jgi:YidC/Oxa1 family membrane protein insertase
MSIPLLDDAVSAVYPLIANLATALGPIGGATAAVVLCTMLLRLLLLPLTLAAVRGERSRAVLAPTVAALQRRHANDPARLRAELSTLYQGAGTSPLAGCLPVLAQSPFLIVWYRVFTAPRIAGHPNALLAHNFLAATLFGGGHLLVFAPLLAVLVALGLLAMRRARHVAAVSGAPAPRGVLALVPFLSLVSAAWMPLAAVVYLVTTLTWTAAENAVLRRGLPAVHRC